MGDSIMDRLREIVLFVAGLIALGSLIMAAYEGFSQRISSAAFLGTLGVVCTFIVYMPKLEVFKVWGVEAKLLQSLDRAEEIIGRLRRLSALSARVTYLTMAWSNRWGQPTARERMAVLDDLNRQLEEINVSPEERKSVARPLIRMVGVDLYNIYTHVLDRYLNFRNRPLLQKTPRTAEEQKYLDESTVKDSEWRGRALGKGPYFNLEGYDFAADLEKASPLTWLKPEDHAAAERFKKELIALFEGCERKGGYTAEYADYYDRYSGDEKGTDLKIIELFGLNINAK